MAEKKKVESNLIDGAEEVSSEDVEPAPNIDVGTEMRTVREANGFELSKVAADLRIRDDYLEAIENGRYVDLPGTPYAVGFVRAYAEYLSLDATELADRFKAEIADLEHRSDLVFPVPVSEGRLPGGAVFLASLVLAAVVYGVWYFYSTSSKGDVVSATPHTTSKVVKSASSTKTTARVAATDKPAARPSRPKAKAVPPNPEAPSAKVVVVKTKPATPPAKIAVVKTKPAMPPAAVPEAKPSKPQAAAPKAKPGAPDTAPPAQPLRAERNKFAARAWARSTPAPAPPEKPDAVTKTGEAGKTPAPTAVRGATAEAPKPAATDKRPRTKLAALPEGTRVVLRATADTWIQVRSRTKGIVVSKVLKQGAEYEVQAQRGMLLHVGNAGTLQIDVNGRSLKPLGPVGMARRNVSLDPARLSKLP